MQEPLRKIKTFAERLQHPKKETDLTDDAKVYLAKIDDAANRMQTLINELLSYSRLSNKQTFIDTDLNKILGDALKDMEVVINEKKAIIQAAELPVLKAIPAQINQLFHNLISNALKFSKQDVAPVINITAVTVKEDEKNNYPHLKNDTVYCKLSFVDNGIGFEPEYAERVFEIFQRLVGRSEYPGTGIGLAICRKIVTNHHGIIFAFSKENEGAAFHVILSCDTSYTPGEY